MATKFFIAQPPIELAAATRTTAAAPAPTRSMLLAAPVGAALAGAAAAAPSAAVAAAGAAAAASAIAVRNISVEVSDLPIVPTIVREGKEIIPPAFSANRIDDFLAHTSVLPRIRLPVAVSQSIPAGTMVAKGTPVDIVLVPASDIDFGLLQQVHGDLAALPITAALPLVNDPQISPLLARASAADLSADEKAIVTNKLKSTLNVTVDDTNPAKTFELAFDSLKSAQAFA
jgi:hypothetical protein